MGIFLRIIRFLNAFGPLHRPNCWSLWRVGGAETPAPAIRAFGGSSGLMMARQPLFGILDPLHGKHLCRSIDLSAKVAIDLDPEQRAVYAMGFRSVAADADWWLLEPFVRTLSVVHVPDTTTHGTAIYADQLTPETTPM